MPNTRVRLLIAICALITMLLGASSAQASPDWSCPNVIGNGYVSSTCAYVTNRVLVFGDQPGVLGEGTIERTDTTVTTGSVYSYGGSYTENTDELIPYNAAAWTGFVRDTETPNSNDESGAVKFEATAAALKHASVRVFADHAHFLGDDHEARYSLTCSTDSFLTCSTPAVWMKNRDSFPGFIFDLTSIEGLASIETRPLIVKVLNMTDQPLARSGEVSMNGARRDEQVHDPATIAAGTDGRTAAGYYHFYRASSANDTVSINYIFADGAGATSLTGQEIGIDIKIGKDGSTDASSCATPSGGNATIECSVNVLGLADGILEAVVVVGV